MEEVGQGVGMASIQWGNSIIKSYLKMIMIKVLPLKNQDWNGNKIITNKKIPFLEHYVY